MSANRWPLSAGLAAGLIVAGLPSCLAKNPPRWQPATVIHSHHTFANDENVAGDSSVVQTAHEELDLDAGASLTPSSNG